MRIDIEIQRQVVRYLYIAKMGVTKIGELLGISHSTATAIKNRVVQSGIEPEDVLKLNDVEFKGILNPQKQSYENDKIYPDWQYVHLELEKPDMTRSLLWEEYRLRFKGMLEKAIGYQQFTRLYKSWFSKSKLSMIQHHLPGDKIFVDFCGRTVEIIDQSTGEISKAQIFVGVLGASGLIFCTAVASQKVADWILCNVRMLDYFGGVPNQIVSDNLKSAVISNTKKTKTINKSFLEMSLHFDFVVMPARPRRPQDKALAEAAVKIIQRWALAKLRNSVFFSLEDLNDALSRELEILNNKKTKRYPDGRLYNFKKIEESKLKPLPIDGFEIANWEMKKLVPSDYHIKYQDARYSVPHQYYKCYVDLRITNKIIEIFNNGIRVASHALIHSDGVSTQREHMPKNHQTYKDNEPEALIEWASSIGENTFEWANYNINTRKDKFNGVSSVYRLKNWSEKNKDFLDLEKACALAIEIESYNFQRIETIIKNRSYDSCERKPNRESIDHENLRGEDYYKNLGDDEEPSIC